MSKTNFVDKIVDFFSPHAGVKRKQARLLSGIIEQRFYEGAASGRRTDAWKHNGKDANAEIKKALKKLRERSRDLVRNNAFAGRAVQVVVANTIGYGIKGELRSKGAKTSDKTSEAWKTWSESRRCDYAGKLDFYGFQALAKRAVFVDGEVLVKRVRVKPTDEDPIPFKLQLLEADYLDTDKTGDNIVQGIEFKDGKRVAYWLFDKHPGDENAGSLTSKRVPATEILHIYRPDRPGQERGVPWLAPVMITLKELDEYMDASLIKQKVAACFAGFIYDAEGSDYQTSGKPAPISEKIEPASMEVLPQGKDIKFASPPSANDFDPFTRTHLRQISSGVGITYESMTGDHSQVNFSSGRMGWIEMFRNIEVWRWHMFIPQFCDGVADWFDEALGLVSEGEIEGSDRTWTPPRREMIDPSSETNAAINALRAGIKTYPEVQGELGNDWKKQLETIAEVNKEIDRLGLILDSDARRTMKAGVIQTGLDAGKVGDSGAGTDKTGDGESSE